MRGAQALSGWRRPGATGIFGVLKGPPVRECVHEVPGGTWVNLCWLGREDGPQDMSAVDQNAARYHSPTLEWFPVDCRDSECLFEIFLLS